MSDIPLALSLIDMQAATGPRTEKSMDKSGVDTVASKILRLDLTAKLSGLFVSGTYARSKRFTVTIGVNQPEKAVTEQAYLTPAELYDYMTLYRDGAKSHSPWISPFLYGAPGWPHDPEYIPGEETAPTPQYWPYQGAEVMMFDCDVTVPHLFVLSKVYDLSRQLGALFIIGASHSAELNEKGLYNKVHIAIPLKERITNYTEYLDAALVMHFLLGYVGLITDPYCYDDRRVFYTLNMAKDGPQKDPYITTPGCLAVDREYAKGFLEPQELLVTSAIEL